MKNISRIIQEEVNRLLITESSINRIMATMKKYDCAFISACRTKFKNIKNWDRTYPYIDAKEKDSAKIGYEFTTRQNKFRTSKMKDDLTRRFGYNVTKVWGSYPEMTTGIKYGDGQEYSFFVVNQNNDPDFWENLAEISEYYNQDSVLFCPKGQPAYLYGTNAADFPGYHEKGPDSYLNLNASNYQSRIGNKAFNFAPKGTPKFSNFEDAVAYLKSDDGKHEYDQVIYPDDPRTSFSIRKGMRINRMERDRNKNK